MKRFQYLAALTVAGAGFLCGYDFITIKITVIIDAFRIIFGMSTWNNEYQNIVVEKEYDTIYKRRRNLEDTDKNDFIETVISGGYLFGAICGALIASHYGDKFGRKKLLNISTIIFTISSIMQACSLHNYIVFTFCRFIMGLSIGGYSVVCPVYISELSPTISRGEITYSYYIFMVLGITLSSIVNFIILFYVNYDQVIVTNGTVKTDSSVAINSMDWRLSYIFQTVISIAYLLIIKIVPKSPRWLCYKEKNVEALHLIAKIHNTTFDDPKLQKELDDLQNDAIINRSIGSSSYPELFIPSIRRRTYNVIFLHFFQQWIGISIYIAYVTQIFDKFSTFGKEEIIVFIILICMIALFTCFVGMSLIDRYGRKPLLLIGSLVILAMNINSIRNFPYSHNDKYSLTSPLMSFRETCSTVSKKPIYHSKKLNMDFFEDNCHSMIFSCSNSHQFSFNGGNENFLSSSVSELSKVCNDIETNSAIVKNVSFGKYFMPISIFVFLITWLPVPFLYKAEIFPLRVRNKGSSIGTLSFYINLIISSTIFVPFLYNRFDQRVFIFFSINCVIGSLYTIIYCQESKGIPLEKMEEKMSGKIIE